MTSGTVFCAGALCRRRGSGRRVERAGRRRRSLGVVVVPSREPEPGGDEEDDKENTERCQQEPRAEVGRKPPHRRLRGGILLDDDRAVVLGGRLRTRLDAVLLGDGPLLVGEGRLLLVMVLGLPRPARHRVETGCPLRRNRKRLARAVSLGTGGYDDPRGAVAEWLGRGLQSLVQQFESARRLRALTQETLSRRHALSPRKCSALSWATKTLAARCGVLSRANMPAYWPSLRPCLAPPITHRRRGLIVLEALEPTIEEATWQARRISPKTSGKSSSRA